MRSTEQSVGINVGGFCPRHHIMIECAEIVKKTVSAFFYLYEQYITVDNSLTLLYTVYIKEAGHEDYN